MQHIERLHKMGNPEEEEHLGAGKEIAVDVAIIAAQGAVEQVVRQAEGVHQSHSIWPQCRQQSCEAPSTINTVQGESLDEIATAWPGEHVAVTGYFDRTQYCHCHSLVALKLGILTNS